MRFSLRDSKQLPGACLARPQNVCTTTCTTTDKAAYHQERALSLNPNSDLIVVQGEVLTWLGRPEEGIECLRRAMRLNPYHPERFWSHLGRAQYSARVYADAIASYSKLTAPDHTHHAFLAASSAQLGNRTAAGAHAREVLQREPAFTAQAFVGTLHYRNPADGGHVREGLLRRGCRTRDEPQTLNQCADRTSQHRIQRPLPRAWRTGQMGLVLLFLVGSVQERMRQVRSFMCQRSCITADVDGRTESDCSDGHAPR